MARNQYGGPCYKCGRFVEPGTGHFELHKGRWRTQHGLYTGPSRRIRKRLHGDAQ